MEKEVLDVLVEVALEKSAGVLVVVVKSTSLANFGHRPSQMFPPSLVPPAAAPRILRPPILWSPIGRSQYHELSLIHI